MHIWLIHIGEPLPVDGPVRLFRYGLLAKRLIARGHSVTQWAGTLNHFIKKQRMNADAAIPFAPGYDIRLMHGPAFKKNVGVGRIRYQRAVTQSFRRQAETMPRPDAIVASLPTLGLADEATRFGQRWDVPVVVDIRDLWPDIFARVLPSFARPLAGPMLHQAHELCRRACRAASSLTGVSEDYLQWGLRHASRRRTSFDRVFHHGYAAPEPTSDGQRDAEAFWSNLGLQANKFRLCFFGSLGASCELEPFLTAVKSMHASGRDDIELVICGDGPKRTALKRSTVDCPAIRWVDWIDQPKIAELMRRSHAGVAAYGPEAPQSLPNKPIEYLAGELAVLSTLGGSELEQTIADADCGATLPHGSPRAIAETIQIWADTPQKLRSMRSNARRVYEERFNAEHVYTEMATHLEQVQAGHTQAATPLRMAA